MELEEEYHEGDFDESENRLELVIDSYMKNAHRLRAKEVYFKDFVKMMLEIGKGKGEENDKS